MPFKQGNIPHNFGKKSSVDTKIKISNALRGRKIPDEVRKKMSNSRIGHITTEETRRKISITNSGKVRSPEQREKIRKKILGRKLSEETKRKISISGTLRYDRVGRKKYADNYRVRDKQYLQWRSNVFQRDNWTCQTCRKRGGNLEAHHIKSWAKYVDLRLNLENGVTLCVDCHKLTANYKNKQNE